MTINYVDIVGGNDGTADGTTSLPYQTIDAAVVGLAGGDEVRVKKVDVTALSGTVSFTNGSASVNTSADQTSVLTTGDFISKSATGGTEGWWRILSLTSSVITLEEIYTGETAATITGYWVTPITYDTTDSDGSSYNGTSKSSLLKVTGGWNFSNETRDGYTFLTSSGETYSINIQMDYVEVAYFVVYGETYSFRSSSDYSYFHDLYALSDSGASDRAFYFVGCDDLILENCIASHCGYGFDITGSSLQIDSLTVWHAVGANAINFGTSHGLLAKNLYVNKVTSTDFGLSLSSVLWGFIYNFEVETTYGGVFVSNCVNVSIDTLTIGTATNDGVRLSTGTYGTICRNITMGTIGGENYQNIVGSLTTSGSELVVINSGVSYHINGYDSIVRRSNTADARSGTCVQLTPIDADDPVFFKVGVHKIASTASDITLSVYLKEDGSLNGNVYLFAVREGRAVSSYEYQTVTSSYAQYSVVVDTADLVVDEYLELHLGVTGTAGNLYVDDFSAS